MDEHDRIQVAIRRALMVANPLYHALPLEQQERFRLTMDDAAETKARIVLFRELLGIICTDKNVDGIWDELPIPRRTIFNQAWIYITGMGDDMIWLNEQLPEGKSLLDFDTLYDYDLASHRYQEAVRADDVGDYEEQDYYALRLSWWARLLIDGSLHYAFINSLASYVTDELEELGVEQIDGLIPYEYVHGEGHGTPEEGGVLWNTQRKTDGLELHLEELERRWYRYLGQRWIELSQEFVADCPAVYMMSTVDHDGEARSSFLFNNEQALKNTRWRHFLADCKKMELSFAEAEARVQQEWAIAKKRLHEMYSDVMSHFDPTVVPFRRRRRVILPSELFGSLERWQPDYDGND